MGLLDDAIREHLDLKRRSGADPAEIERAEREALGPVRRGPQPAEEIDPDALAPIDPGEPTSSQTHDDEHYAPGDFEERAGDDHTWDEPLDDQPLPPPRATKPIAAPTEEHSLHEAPAPAPRAEDDEPAARPPTGDETVEYDVERALAEEHPAESEDVLEETPDFLQDTPDHDRLWFEQRPPRDFDFDG
jgi:hypothetical protein